jgi:hypothetical protein
MRRRDFIVGLGSTLAWTAAATPVFGQAMTRAVGPARATQSATSVPDLSGVWAKPYFGLELPLSGPGPVMRRPPIDLMVGDYANPILKPEAAEVVKRHGEIELSGVAVANARNQCWPEGVPFVFVDTGMQLLQQPHQITILSRQNHQVRRARMNEPHPARVIPSWYGDSVAHYEGDTLVIDTVSVKLGPFPMADEWGTPRTTALHMVERYRLIDYEAAIEA